MKEYKRNTALFSLCGLNCALCPRFHTEGTSKCPGCGGEDFSLKHPTCAVVTCNDKHDHVEFCFECSQYPCERYKNANLLDSFISYKNVSQNMADAKQDLHGYLTELKEKQAILETLIGSYNDGRSKGFYCLAVNLLPLVTLRDIMQQIHATTDVGGYEPKAVAKVVIVLIKEKATELHIELKLRK